MEARFTPEVRAKLSEIAKNRSFSAETRRRIAVAQNGKKRGPRPVEIVEKIAERQRGQPRPNQRGEKHHNWKGGKRPLRNRVEDNRWKTAVVERDGRTCRRCGSTTNLVAHHFKSWDDFPDLRLDVDNGITLCKACHTSVHERNDPAFVHIPGAS
ncbi:MAG: HNH endonuclease [Tepidisphaeraceae bacterium]